MAEHGPSEKAIDAAFRAMDDEMRSAREKGSLVEGRPTTARALAAAQDPMLGLDRSVCLRDVYDWLRFRSDFVPLSRLLEREFTESSSPDREEE